MDNEKERWRDKFVRIPFVCLKEEWVKFLEIAEEEESTPDLLLSDFVKGKIKEGKK